MNRTEKLLHLLAAAICTIALPVLAADDSPRIRAGTESWIKSFNSGNAGAVVALYADDGVLMPPNAPQARGIAAIKVAIAKEIADARKGGITLSLGTEEVGVVGDMAWHAGTVIAKDKSGKTVSADKFLEVWEKKNGKWRIVRDMWNSDNAPGAPPAAAPPAPEPKKK